MIAKEVFSSEEKARIREWSGGVRAALLANRRQFEQYPVPLLLAGDVYRGIWLEHNQDNIFLADYDPESAWASQQAFMRYQREDGLLPFVLPLDTKTGYFKCEAGYGQVQCIFPFTRCAMAIAQKTQQNEEALAAIYRAGSRYDQWFGKYRNRRGTGLAEMYCEWDTGHDNDPRVTDDGIPHGCPDKDAVNMPNLPIMPVLSVDLSAMLYGNRMALAELATMLGKDHEAALWHEQAAEIKAKIDARLYCAEDDFYYDRDSRGLRKYRTEHITRLFLNRVLDQDVFDRIYTRYFHDPKEFMPAYPIPAVAVADPHFIKECPKNSWGANTQALTTLRAIFWMKDYGRQDELKRLLLRWLRAFIAFDSKFPQEINPFTGAPIGTGVNYSPSLIIFLEAAKIVCGNN